MSKRSILGGSKRAKAMESVITRLIDLDFKVPSELDGDAACFYCDAYLDGGEEHEKDCPYLEAKRLLDSDETLSDWHAIDSSAPLNTPLLIASLDGRVGEGTLYRVNEANMRPGQKPGDIQGHLLRPDSWGETHCSPVGWLPIPEHPETEGLQDGKA